VTYALLHTGWRAQSLDDTRRKWAALGCLLGAAGILLHAVVDFPLQMPAVAALLAVLLGAARGLAVPARRTFPPSRAATVVAAAGFCFLALSLLAGSWEAHNVQRLADQGQTAAVEGRTEEAESLYVQALNANPHAAAVWLKRAELAEMVGESESAIAMARLARRLEPFALRTEWPLANLYLRNGEMEQAAKHCGLLARALPRMRPTILDTAWNAGLPPELISSRIVPREAEAVGEYLSYLARREAWDTVLPAWQTLNPAGDLSIPALMLRYTFGRLFDAGRGMEYRRLWQLTEKLPGPAERSFTIEKPAKRARNQQRFGLDGYGFRWVQEPMREVAVSPVEDESGSAALEIHFREPQDLHYRHLYHDFPVESSTAYLLRAEVLAE
jgi:tetratricopeptide (TPR) repeat protein